jgi:hypothetical protein
MMFKVGFVQFLPVRSNVEQNIYMPRLRTWFPSAKTATGKDLI